MGTRRRRLLGLWYGLLALPFAAMLWIGFYDRAEPALFGFPFFYWYQLAWIPLGSLALLPLYFCEDTPEDEA